jgi:hypothetical protein
LITLCSPVSTPLRSNVNAFNNEGNNGKFEALYINGQSGTVTDASGAALVLTGATVHYTRVGKRFLGSLYVAFPVTANANNSLIDMGLSFVCSNALSSRAGATIAWTDTANAQYAFLLENTDTIRIYKDSIGTRATNADLSGKTILIMLNFEIA